MVTEYGMSSKLGAVRYGTEHGDPFLGRTMGTQADYSHEVARDIDDEVRKLIEAAHDEAWAILTEHRDVLDVLAAELLEKETLHRAELEVIFAGIQKRPRLSVFDDFGGRIPSDKPPIKTPGELAIERGEPWPQPVPEPAYKNAIAAASAVHAQQQPTNNGNGAHPTGRHHAQNAPAQPNYGAPSGWHAPGWPPPQPQQPQPQQPQPQQPQPQQPQPQQQGYWYPPPPGWGNSAQHPGQQPPQHQPHPSPAHSGSGSQDEPGQDSTYRPTAD
jgi:cell division protease FtsH